MKVQHNKYHLGLAFATNLSTRVMKKSLDQVSYAELSINDLTNLLLNVDDIPKSMYMTINRVLENNYEHFLSPEIYNDLSNGRMKFLVALSLFYQKLPNETLLSLIKELFSLFIKDTRFYKNHIAWLFPTYQANQAEIFVGNVGIYTGLIILKEIWQDKSFDILLNSITFDIDTQHLNKRQQKAVKSLLKEEHFSEKDIYNFIRDINKTKKVVLLEVGICWLIKHKVDKNSSFFRAITEIYQTWVISGFIQSDEVVDSLLNSQTNYFDVSHFSESFLSSKQLYEEIITENFPRLIQYCNLNSNYFQRFATQQQLSSSLFLNDVISHYSGVGKTFLRQLIALQKKKISSLTLFKAPVRQPSYEYYRRFCNMPMPDLFKEYFSINIEDFKVSASSIPWNGLETSKVFDAQFMVNKLASLRKRNLLIINIFKPQRFEKRIVWDVKDLIQKKHIDFFMFVSNQPSSIETYKERYPNKMDDTELYDLLLTFLRIGVLKPFEI